MPSKDLKPLLELYSTTVFLCNEPIHWSKFAIVTACNPLGKILSESENESLLKNMQTKLTAIDFKIVTGASPDLSHQEKSFAVNCSKPKAVSLAKSFQQNAIFWVDNGEVTIEPVSLSFEPVHIGRFVDRIKT